MEFISIIKNKRPKYLIEYNSLFDRFVVPSGDAIGSMAKRDAIAMGKTFHNNYQFYMYAVVVGLHINQKLNVKRGEGKDFWEMKSWSPSKLVDYIIMMVIVKEKIELSKILDFNDEQLSEMTNQIFIAFQGYANGGLDYIKSKLGDREEFFDSQYWYIELLEELVKERSVSKVGR